MYQKIHLLVEATIQTSYKTIEEALLEIHQKAACTISNTKKVKVHAIKFKDCKFK